MPMRVRGTGMTVPKGVVVRRKDGHYAGKNESSVGPKTALVARKTVASLADEMEKRMYPQGLSVVSGSSAKTLEASKKPQKSAESRSCAPTVSGTRLSKSTELRLWSKLFLRIQKARMAELAKIEKELLEESKWYEVWANGGEL